MNQFELAKKHFLEGLSLFKLQNYEAAEGQFRCAIAIVPDRVSVLVNLSATLVRLRKFSEAKALATKSVSIDRQAFDGWLNLGICLNEESNFDQALAAYDKVLGINPNNVEAWTNRAITFNNMRRYEESLAACDYALSINPVYVEAWTSRGVTLKHMGRRDEALAACDKALSIDPVYVEAWTGRGAILIDMNRHQEALAACDKALSINSKYAEAWYNRGTALGELKLHEAALQSYDTANALEPDMAFLLGMRLHAKMRICDWDDVDELLRQLAARIQRGEKASPSFPVLALSSSLPLQRKAAEIWVQEKCPLTHALPVCSKRPVSDKIRVAYYSADFHEHATAQLMAGLFESHDRSKYELIAFSFGPDTKDEMRSRVVAAFDKFIDVRTHSDKDVALVSRSLGVDIAVDLKGFTQHSRPGIFSFRAAPLQVSYLGYPGTMGAEYIDYLIADPIIIPEASQQHYSEKIVYLPNSYQANDAKRRVSNRAFTRQELGLPQTGIVFCCFNNSYKITRGTFDGWMRILRQVEGSLLWLLEDNAKAASNLLREAAQRGVDAERLIFAQRMPLSEHLARHRWADLFIDTLPCNAHTTASDALWAGVPVLTCIGEAFASRVAASLLNAIQLPELITSTQEEYEALAIELATDPERLAHIKQVLANNRLTTPLFDTQLFTRHLEAAYTAMYERYQADSPPAHIYVGQS